jgi:hypothetical protein
MDNVMRMTLRGSSPGTALFLRIARLLDRAT